MTRITRNKNKQFRKKSLLRRRNTRKKYNKRTSRKKGGGGGCSTMNRDDVVRPRELKQWDGAHFDTQHWLADNMKTKLGDRTIVSSWGERLYVLLGEFFDGTGIMGSDLQGYKINKADKELYLEFYNDKKDWLAKQWYIYTGGPNVMTLNESDDKQINVDHVDFFAWLTQTPTLTGKTALYVDLFKGKKAPNPCEYESSLTDV